MTRNELKEIIKECIEERNSILEYDDLGIYVNLR